MFSKRAKANISGALLVADFQATITNLVTAHTATAAARQSEADVTAALEYGSQNNGIFMTPGDLSPVSAEAIAKTSVDAHLKKIQAAQISDFTAAEIAREQAECEKNYKGRKVTITRVSDSADVFASLWANKQTGELREGIYKNKSMSGTIDDLSLQDNALVLRPTFVGRTILPSRKYFLVRVINIETLEPAVTITLV